MPSKSPGRPKRIPSRTCVGCGTVAAKRDLVRVVRTPEGGVLPDPSGRQPGRGAYLCRDPLCWEQAARRGRLERALRTKLSAADADNLRSFGRNLNGAPG